jgi:regulator of Ty1 transposition protein 103
MHDPSTPLPTPPVHAARLSQLLKALANAESSVSEVIKSRLALIDGLEKLLETNRSALSREQSLATQLSERRSETEAKKREVEDGIMRGLSAENSPAANFGDSGVEGEPVARPEVEALTPPPVEALTPVGSPKQEQQETSSVAQNNSHAPNTGFTLPGFGYPTDAAHYNLQHDPNGLHTKRRKVAHEEEDYAQFAGGDLDADVAELLKQESGLPK